MKLEDLKTILTALEWHDEWAVKVSKQILRHHIAIKEKTDET